MPYKQKLLESQQQLKMSGPEPELPTTLKSLLSKDGADWLVSALDPFHDFERSIEGGPDEQTGRSVVRRYDQTYTLSANADGDNIAIDYYGLHGGSALFTSMNADSTAPLTASTVNVSPITVIRCPSGTHCTVGDLISTAGTKLAGFDTVQDLSIPSRLLSLGVEVVDLTPPIYSKGSLLCVHGNGRIQEGQIEFYSGDNYYYRPVNFMSVMPIAPGVMGQFPGAYIGKAHDGVYTQARLVEMQPPTNQTLTSSAGEYIGTSKAGVCIQYASANTPRVNRYVTSAATCTILNQGNTPSPSGFLPFRIFLSGLPAEGIYQITIRSISEYFPEPTHLMQLGMATRSPDFDPFAFAAYHDTIRSMPFAVPVGFNAAGDWWKMVKRVMRGTTKTIVKHGPAMLELLGGAASMMGHPEAGAGAQLVASMVRNRPKKVSKKKLHARKRVIGISQRVKR